MSDTGLVHSVYRIDRKKALTHSLKKRRIANLDKQLNECMVTICSSMDEGYKRVDFSSIPKADDIVEMRLYTRTNENKNEDFVAFFEGYVQKGDIDAKASTFSSVLFIVTKKNIYAITTGSGRYAIQKYIEDSFGLKIISLDTEKLRIGSRSTNSLSGVVHATAEKYAYPVSDSYVRSSFKLIKSLSGKIAAHSQLHSRLSLLKDKEDKEDKKDKDIPVIARDYIKIGVKCSLEDLCSFVKSIDELGDLSFTLCSIKEFEGDTEALYEDIFEQINNQSKDLALYIWPKDVDNAESEEVYIECAGKKSEEGQLSFPLDMKDLCCIHQKYFHDLTIGDFFKEAQLKRNKPNDGNEFGVSLISALNGEVKYDDGYHSIIYGKPYDYDRDIRKKTVDELIIKATNSKYKDLFKNNIIKLCKSEEDVIIKLCEAIKDKIYPVHKIIVNGIEFADILYETDEKLYVVHIKCGFDCHMRELQKQIELSAQMYIDYKYRQNGKENAGQMGSFCAKVRDRITENSGVIKDDSKLRDRITENSGVIEDDSEHTIKYIEASKPYLNEFKKAYKDNDGFRKLLDEKKIVYVAALIVDEKTKDLESLIKESKSVTALYCLNELYKSCAEIGIDFSPCLIHTSSQKK